MKIEDFLVTPSPHIRDSGDVSSAMYDVILALMPAFVAGMIFFGFMAIYLTLICITTTVLSEIFIRVLLRKNITIWDGSAILTGILLALCLPPSTPWWLAVIGSSCAIILGKELFGGLGHNIFNPALVGRTIIFFFIPWKNLLNNFPAPFWWTEHGFFTLITSKKIKDAYTIICLSSRQFLSVRPLDSICGATPMMAKRLGGSIPSYLPLLIGNIRGNMGETSAIALLIGASYLLYKKHIDLHIPLSILITASIVLSMWGHDPLFHILTGGFILGSFFMATDWVTSPSTKAGKIIYGIAIGIFVAAVRIYGVKTEGMGEAILHMNVLALFIDHYTQPKPFGG